MIKMNKLINALLLLMLPVITFAQQQQRPARASRAAAADQFDGPTHGGGFNEPQFATPGGNTPVPIDDYTLFLIGVALLIIAYVVYRRNQLSKA